MTDRLPHNRPPVLGPFLLGLLGGAAVLLVVLYVLVLRGVGPSQATVVRMLLLPFAGAFLWSGTVRGLIPAATLGVPAAGYAAVWAVVGLVLLLWTMDTQYLVFLFISFICLFLGRLGERAARWVFPERFEP